MLKEYLKLARIPEAFVFPFFSVTTSYLFASNGVVKPDIIIPVSAAIFGTAGMCALNDYFDIEADKLSVKNRPLASGKIALKDGLSFVIILTIAGMIIAGLSDKALVPVIGGLAVFIGLLYNWKTKGLGIWGTINFGFIMVTMVSLGIAQIDTTPIDSKYFLFLCFVFFAAAGNQSTANFYDFESDKEYGYQTIPNIYGIKRGALIVLVIRFMGFSFFTLFLFKCGMLDVITSIALFTIAFLILASHRFLKIANEAQSARTAFKISIAMTLLCFCTIVFGLYY